MNFNNAFDQVKNTIFDVVKSAFDRLIIPVLMLACVGILAFNIFQCISLKRQGRGDEIQHHVISIVVIIVVMALLGVYSSWAWGLIG